MQACLLLVVLPTHSVQSSAIKPAIIFMQRPKNSKLASVLQKPQSWLESFKTILTSEKAISCKISVASKTSIKHCLPTNQVCGSLDVNNVHTKDGQHIATLEEIKDGTKD